MRKNDFIYVIEEYSKDYDILPGFLLEEQEKNGKKTLAGIRN